MSRRALWVSLLIIGCGAPAVIGYDAPVVQAERSLFWADDALLDDPSVVSFAKLMATVAPDGHGGQMFQQWFQRFGNAKAQEFIDAVEREQGADATKWDLSRLPFKVTGVHNRLDLAEYGAHCGELRVSVSGTALELQPFHVLFIFRQPSADYIAVARRWAELSRLEGDALREAVRAEWREGLVRERFVMLETLELSKVPWEWRQWTKELENPPLFQQLDVEALNVPGPRRDALLKWVEENAEALNSRAAVFPAELRAPTATVKQIGGERFIVPLSLDGLRADVAERFPNLRKQIEAVGCVGCHTADADFVQTRTARTPSPFYEKELKARVQHLERLARGERPFAPFGPLQAEPVLPE